MVELGILTYPNPILLAKALLLASRVSSAIQRLAHYYLGYLRLVSARKAGS